MREPFRWIPGKLFRPPGTGHADPLKRQETWAQPSKLYALNKSDCATWTRWFIPLLSPVSDGNSWSKRGKEGRKRRKWKRMIKKQHFLFFFSFFSSPYLILFVIILRKFFNVFLFLSSLFIFSSFFSLFYFFFFKFSL